MQTKLKKTKDQPENLSKSFFPDGYNGEQLAKVPYSLALDYLIINFHSTDLEIDLEEIKVPHFEIKKLPYSTKVFSELYEIFYNSEKFALLTRKPHSKVIDQKLNQIQFENQFLYLPPNQLWQIINRLIKPLSLHFVSFNRVDIALDMMENDLKINPFALVQKINNREILISGREKAFNLHTFVRKGFVFVQGFSLGKRSGERFFRCYDKTLEMSNNPKPHISKLHEINGLTGKIWRFEFQLNNKFITSLETTDNINFDFHRLFMSESWLELWLIAKKNFFAFKQNQGAKEINKNLEWEWLPIQNIKNSLKYVVFGFTRKTRQVLNNTIESAKRLLKGNIREYYKNQNQLPFLLSASKVLDQYNLYDFFEKKFPEWISEFNKKSKLVDSFNYEVFQNDFQLIQTVEI